MQAFEFMLVMVKGEPTTWNPQTRPNKSAGQKKHADQRYGGNTNNGTIKQNREWVVADNGIYENVWRIPVGGAMTATDGTKHPAMFPEALAERHILTWSNPGDVVLDFFSGSGTTAKMARKHARRWYYCDISPQYAALAEKRLSAPYTPDMFATLAEAG